MMIHDMFKTKNVCPIRKIVKERFKDTFGFGIE